MPWKFSLFIVLLLLSSCKEKKEELPIVTDVEIPDGFKEFYDQFHQDSIFQLRQIVFPLPGKIEEDGSEGYWQKTEWTHHNKFDSSYSNYQIHFTVMGDIVIESVVDTLGYFSMERRFAIVQGEWHLIFYRAIYNNPNLEMD